LSKKALKIKFLWKNPVFFFGSDPSCEFYLKGWGIKPKQAIILKEGIEFRLINLIEGKGVLLNGKKVKDVLLKDRDRITVADYDYEFCIELTP
jgi:pSer/pThr/pTyr-binding forkhead associated (FHA) protein